METKKDIIGFIPAAGKGTRFMGIGKHYPKTLLPYKEMPILFHNMRWLEQQGCKKILISAREEDSNKFEDMIDIYLSTHRDLESNLEAVDLRIQQDLSGPGATLSESISDYCNGEYVLMCLSDVTPDTYLGSWHNDEIQEMLNERQPFLTYKSIETEVSESYCVLEYEDVGKGYGPKMLSKLLDKTGTSYGNYCCAINGIYFFDSATLFSNPVESYGFLVKDSTEVEFSDYLAGMNFKKRFRVVEYPVIDLGTLSEYLNNKDVVNGSRHFNDVQIMGSYVAKSSSNLAKLASEYQWYQSVPQELQRFTPKILVDLHQRGYSMERVSGITLREAMLYWDISPNKWANIYNNIDSFMSYNGIDRFEEDKKTAKEWILNKYTSRVQQLPEEISAENSSFIYNLQKSLDEQINKSDVYGSCGFVHGDLCFSNIMVDVNSPYPAIKLIDPRGQMYGPKIYEWAKLVHSIVYNYDLIDSKMYTVRGDSVSYYGKNTENAKRAFRDRLSIYHHGCGEAQVHLVVASLFVSMIPLHENPLHHKLFMLEARKAYSNYLELIG